MASHPHTSPHGPYHGHHRQPMPAHHPNGHPPPPQQKTIQELLQEGKEDIYLRIGSISQMQDDPDGAMAAYGDALKNNPSCIPAIIAIADILKDRDQYGPAIDYYQQSTRLDENNGEVWANLGHCFLMMDNLADAYQAYQTALYHLHDLSQPRLWYGIGILYDRYGSLEHAEEAFSQVMRMAPDFEKANEIYFRLGIIYKQQQKFPQSLDCFRYIVSNPPKPLTEEDIWFQLGHVYEQQKDFASAKDAYKRVLERDPKHAKVLQQLGWLHHQQSQDYANQEQAIEYLEKSVASDQNDAQSWYLLGRCYMAQQKYPRAYEAYQQAVYRDGRNPTFWCSIGVLYYQINQYRDALDAYSRAIRLNPNISEVWYDLGTLYESCNNQTADALDAYQRAAELDPTNVHIKARLDLLRRGPQENTTQPPGPQELHPQAYQPTTMTGPPGPQWGAPGPTHGAPPRVQAPQLDYTNRLNDIQTIPPQGPQQVPTYEHREGGPPPPHAQNLPGPPKPPSPRQEPPRHYPPAPHYPGEAQPPRRSPSPKSRNAPIPYASHPSNGPPPPVHQQHQPPAHPPQSNRIPNPNYDPHNAPPHTGPTPVPPPTQATNAYNRSPPPGARHNLENRPGSTGLYAPEHHRSTSSLPPPGQGPPPNSSEPNRDEASRTPIPKRHREWEDEPNSAKSQHIEEKRPRLDEHVNRLPSLHDGVPSPPRPMGNEPPSRPEEHRRLDNYHPSEAAHHPPPQSFPPPVPKTQPTPPQSQGPPPPPPTFTSQNNDQPRPKESPPHEPAARKMEVDENYDDDGEDEKRPIAGVTPTKRESPRTERHEAPTEAKVEA